MLKQTVSYFDFDDNPSQETLYFNLTKTELADNIHLQAELEQMQETFSVEKERLTPDEIRQLVDIVKTIMRLSYGVRSADGKRFVKTEELWTEFTQTAAYDAFLYSLFEDPNKAVMFMTGILPKEVRNTVEKVGSGGSAEEISKKIAELKEAPKDEPAVESALTPEQQAEALAEYQRKLQG